LVLAGDVAAVEGAAFAVPATARARAAFTIRRREGLEGIGLPLTEGGPGEGVVPGGLRERKKRLEAVRKGDAKHPADGASGVPQTYRSNDSQIRLKYAFCSIAQY
jgi:hypothetical protein